MVRNAASMQSLRNSMADVTISSEPGPAQQQNEDAPYLQRLDASGPAMQICGNDPYTKSLMTKVATGQATAEEEAAFNTQVNRASSLPSIQNLVQPISSEAVQDLEAQAEGSQQPRVLGTQSFACSPMLPGMQEQKKRLLETAQQAEESQQPQVLGTQPYGCTGLWSLKPENKERLMRARQQQEAEEHQSTTNETAGQRAHEEEAEAERRRRQDYQMQLMLLEQQNKKRLLLARQEREAEEADAKRRNAENEDYQMQLMLLEQQNKKRLLMARQELAAQQREEEEPCRQPRRSEVLQNWQDKLLFYEDRTDGKPLREFPKQAAEQAEQAEARPVRGFYGPPRQDYQAQVDQLERAKQRKLENDRQQQHAELPTSKPEQPQSQSPMSKLAYKRQSFTPNARLDDVWKKQAERQKSSPPKSKGLAATLAANEEAQRFKQATRVNAAKYTKPFCDFLTDNPTVFHCVDAMKKQMLDAGWTQLSERDSWDLKPSGSYFVERNGSSLITFVVGAGYEPGNGAAILAGHVDALTAKLKPISQVPNKAGYLQLGVAPYAGGLGRTWWDRDLGIGGRVHIKEGDKIVTKLVKLDWPIAKIPSLAEHFGAVAAEPFINPNKETQMVPIIGLGGTESSDMPYGSAEPFSNPPLLGGVQGPVGSFVQTQPPALVKAITNALGMGNTYPNIINWELELFDVQPATVAGLNKEFISAGRIDDKLCSWAAFQAILDSQVHDTKHSSLIKVVGLFDDEEIGSLLRQGARGNFLPMTLERAVGSLAGGHPSSDLMGRTYANSFLVSSDVTHAVNPNFLGQYLENHAPHLNVGVAVAADSNGHMTTDSVSTTILKRCADKVGAQLQVFQIRNDSRSGGTVGPMLSSALGIRAIDAGLAQLSMHSIRATCGALDPGLGVLMFTGFLNGFEEVDKEMQD